VGVFEENVCDDVYEEAIEAIFEEGYLVGLVLHAC